MQSLRAREVRRNLPSNKSKSNFYFYDLLDGIDREKK
jgi:hypothetical protein